MRTRSSTRRRKVPAIGSVGNPVEKASVIAKLESLPETVRAFVALRLDTVVERAILSLVEELRATPAKVRWVGRHNFHLTLKFLGDAAQKEKLADLATALHAIASRKPKLDLRARGTGAFPNLRRPRVIFVGLEGEGLVELAREVEAAAAEAGFARERRAFSAHLTIGRVRAFSGFDATRTMLEAAAGRDFGSSRIETMTLCRSILGPDGATYEEIAAFPLSCGPAPGGR